MFWNKKPPREDLTEDERLEAIAAGASIYARSPHGSLNDTVSRSAAINSDIASWGFINSVQQNILLSWRAAKLDPNTIIPYGSHSGNTQTNRMGTISGLAIGFVLLVALLGLLSMMGIIPRPGGPTHPIEPPAGGGWTIEEVPCPPNVEPGTIIMESQTPDYPGLQKGG